MESRRAEDSPNALAPVSGPRDPAVRTEGFCMININDESMTLVIDDRVVATTRYSLHAAANGRGA